MVRRLVSFIPELHCLGIRLSRRQLYTSLYNVYYRTLQLLFPLFFLGLEADGVLGWRDFREDEGSILMCSLGWRSSLNKLPTSSVVTSVQIR